MRSFSYRGLEKYLETLGDFKEIKIIVVETPSHYYQVYVHQLADLEHLTQQAIFNIEV